MRKFVKYLFFTVFVFLIGCDDVLEEDISDDNITIIAPADGTAIEGNVVQFRWNSLDGVDEYRLQIMGENQFIVFDSLVGNEILDHQMEPGEYTWRIRGENFAYTTPYTFEYSFSVEESLDLSNQLITLQEPGDDYYTNNGSINFSWQAIGTADTYEFDLLKVEASNQTSIFKETDLVNPTVSINDGIITDDAEYLWRVRAKNQSSMTEFFSRKLFLDTETPPVPALNTPTTDQSFGTSEEVSFTWNFVDTGEVQSAITSTITIATDENFSSLLVTETSETEEFQNSFDTAGTYYWRVKGTDAAGNKGVYSDSGSFVIN